MRFFALLLLSLCLKAGDPRPLPELEPLVRRIVAATKARAGQREAYCWVAEEAERKLDGKGRVTSQKVQTFEVTRLAKGSIRKLVAVDGAPLSPEKAQAEEARVQKHIAELQARELVPPPPSEKKASEVTIQLEDLIAVMEVKRMERTLHGKTPVLALYFCPKKGVSTSGLGQRFASKLEGCVLVDEATDQVVRAEGRLVESCWIGGGLLGAVAPPTTFHFEMVEVAPGLWMPAKAGLTLFSRVTFVPLRLEFSSLCRDYRRFQAEVVEARPEVVKQDSGK